MESGRRDHLHGRNRYPLSYQSDSVRTGVECIFGEAPLHTELQARSGASVNFVTLVLDLRT